MDANGGNVCDINKCKKLDMENDQDVNLNILKKIHCHYMHCYDVGYQIHSGSGDNNNEQNEESKSHEIEIDIEAQMKTLNTINKSVFSGRHCSRYGTNLNVTPDGGNKKRKKGIE